MKRGHLVKIGSVILGPLLVALSTHGQGALAPPGAPGETMKTLEQVEPRIDVATLPVGGAFSNYAITNSGSYYLSADLEVTEQAGISINVDDVTLDLNGFRIFRSPLGGIVDYGIHLQGRDRIKIMNGTVSGFTVGIFQANILAASCVFEDLLISGCAYGLQAVSANTRISNCRSSSCSTFGFQAGDGAIIDHCQSFQDGNEYGIRAGKGALVKNCTVREMQGFIGSGIRVNEDSSVLDCVVSKCNVSKGIETGDGSIVERCTVSQTSGGNAGNQGILTGESCLVSRCTVNRVTTTNGTGQANNGVGISVEAGSTVQDCVVSKNTGDGILLTHDCLIRNNVCDENGGGTSTSYRGANIHANNGDNRIENNQMTDADVGLQVELSASLIVRNSAAANATNYVIAANNKVGEIIDTLSSPAISGKTGGSGIGTANPWDNFSY